MNNSPPIENDAMAAYDQLELACDHIDAYDDLSLALERLKAGVELIDAQLPDVDWLLARDKTPEADALIKRLDFATTSAIAYGEAAAGAADRLFAAMKDKP